MTVIIEENIIPVAVYDLSGDNPTDLPRGFYYTIGDDEEDKNDPSFNLVLAGPYPSHDEALQAAGDFIAECLTDHSKELGLDP